MTLVLIGKDLLLEAKQRTNGFQVGKYSIHGAYGISDQEFDSKKSSKDPHVEVLGITPLE